MQTVSYKESQTKSTNLPRSDLLLPRELHYIYKHMILPILEYGDIFLHSATQKIRKKLQTLQNKALRCALGKDKITGSDLLHE